MAQADREALGAFYNATGGPNWRRQNKNWNTDADLSEWHGIETNDQGRVVGLSLFNNNLQGPIPSELGDLRELQWLRLNNNQLTGSIPPELGQLTALKELYLSSNQLSGPIPPQLGQLGALKTLILSRNKLDGAIPAQLGALNSVTWLDLSDNQLSGSIPPELGKLAVLQDLDLSMNHLTGSIPPELGKLAALKILGLSGNQLSVVPRAFAEAFSRPGMANVHLHPNPWKQPPVDVLKVGMAAAISYLDDLKHYGSTSSNRLKVVLVGLANAGKTSIATRLDSPAACLPTTEERTVGVEIRDIELGPGPPNPPGEARTDDELDVKLWDFAGQRAYYETHQLFLTQDALFVLVVDIFAYSERQTREDALEQWLDILQSRVPGSVVLLVGTHCDLFRDSTLRSDRMRRFKEDVRKVVKRLRRECELLEVRTKSYVTAGKGKDFQPLRVVVEDVLALDLSSPENEEIGQLQRLIERVAYNGYDGYSFPSVRSVLPKPYPLAFATLEGVRRGANLRKVGGDLAKTAEKLRRYFPVKRRPFIRFSEALSRFGDVLGEGKGAEAIQGPEEREGEFLADPRAPAETEDVFLKAVQLYENQGAILLTCVDGDREEPCHKSTRVTASKANLIIHVNPAYFADVVRRIADIRLVEPLEQQSVRQVLHEQPECTFELTQQHASFFQAGEVSRNYLKFLWLRDMKLGGASTEAPPLVMTDEDISVWVESLLDVGFILRVRNKDGCVVPDRYVVASCLPDHVPYKVNPVEILGLRVGCALFSQELEVVGAHAVPHGLVPRFLAWCGRGNARIEACWKQGVCLALNGKHLVLLCERRTAAGTAFLDCYAQGQDEEAGRAVQDVAAELDRLVSDKRYGFPGILLSATGGVVKKPAGTIDDLRCMLKELGDAMKDYMNVKCEELERKSETIADAVRQCLQMERTLSSRLDSLAAVTNECLLVSIRKEVPCPRLVIIEPDSPASPAFTTPSRFSHFRREMMDTLLRTMGQSQPVCLRVRFLCAHDLSAADCGEDGLGYTLEFTKWQQWLRKCLPIFQVSLFLLRVGISVVARADVLPVDTLMGKLREVTGEEVAGCIERVDLESLHQAPEGDHTSSVGKKVEVFGRAYQNLAKLVEQEEKTIAVEKRVIQDLGVGASSGTSRVPSLWRRILQSCCSWSPISGNAYAGGGSGTSAAPVSTVRAAGERSFQPDMVLAIRQRGQSAPECAWVRQDNQRAWENFDQSALARNSTP